MNLICVNEKFFLFTINYYIICQKPLQLNMTYMAPSHNLIDMCITHKSVFASGLPYCDKVQKNEA